MRTVSTRRGESTGARSIRIIVHPERLTDLPTLSYWTEVVEMPRCMATGFSEEEVVEQTLANIDAALAAEGRAAGGSAPGGVELSVESAL